MLKQFNEKFWSEFVKKRGSLVLGPNEQKSIIDASKVVRQRDYIINLDVKNGLSDVQTITTRANWLFLLTNIYFYCQLTNSNVLNYTPPKVSLDFPYYAKKTPFETDVKDFSCVPAKIVFGVGYRPVRFPLLASYERLEEFKNLYYLLGERFVINAEIKPESGLYCRGHLLLTGLEIDLDGIK